jgi:hypothetical protein
MLNLASDLRSRVEAVLENRIPRALTPPQRSIPELMPTGIASVDALTGGIPLGCLTEICGAASSGRTSVLMALLAQCMRRGEICAVVDASDAFDPQSAANTGVDLERLLWVRCGQSGDRVIGPSGEVRRGTQHSALSIQPEKGIRQSALGARPVSSYLFQQNTAQSSLAESRQPTADSPLLEQALKATDLLLQAGGFGLIVLDLADIPVSAARRIPLTTWFRFRRTVENTSTALVVVEEQPHAKSCASLVMEFAAKQASWSEAAEPEGTMIGAHSGASSPALGEVAFCVTSQGIAIPFERSTSSFEMPQRWDTPRLLDSVHVHLQVTRSRINRVEKFPVQPERPFAYKQSPGENTKDTKVMQFLN